MKKIIPHVKRVVLLLICLAAVIPAMSMKQAEAASLSSKNRKAHILYDKKVKAAKRISTSVQYKYADITGDGVHEAIIDYHPKNGGSGLYFCIYTYKNGKAKQLLKYGQYGLTKLSVYKKTKTIVCYGAGHGGEWYSFLKLKNGKYKEIAGKSRRGIAGGFFTKLLVGKDLVAPMESCYRKRMKPFGYMKNEDLQRQVAGETARGLRYSYQVNGTGMTGESFVLTRDKTRYYLHVYYRTQLGDESREVWKSILDSAGWQ